MSGDMGSLHVCGNILTTKNYSYFALRCSHCSDSFGQWTSFIKHLERKHNNGDNDSLNDVIKCENGRVEFMDEDSIVDSIKDELDSMGGDDDNKAELDNSEIKDESEKEDNTGNDEVAIQFEETMEDDEDTYEDTQWETKRFKKTPSWNEVPKKDTGIYKSFTFNIRDDESKYASVEFLRSFQTNSVLWDFKHEDFRNLRARLKALAQLQLDLKKIGYTVTDASLSRIIAGIVRDYRKAKELFTLDGTLSDKFLLFILNKCRFMDDPIDAAKFECVPGEEQANKNDDYDSDDFDDKDEYPELTEVLTNNPKSRYKRIRFHVANNKLVIDLISLWHQNPVLWDATRPDYNNLYDRRHILESWIEIFKQRHSVTFTFEDMKRNLQLLRRNYNAISSRKELDEAAKYIRDNCNFLPTPKKQGKITCEHCDSFFIVENNYRAHLYSAHQIGDSPYKCTECGKMFNCAGNLDEHMKQIHIKDFQFTCIECDKRFLRKFQLTTHMQIHTGEKSFICETCGKGFRRVDHLKNHEVRIHLRQRNFPCTMCPKAFYTKQLLRDHINAHLNIRNFKCPFCEKAFHSAHARMRHKQIHSEVKRYACKLCDAKFHQFVGLNSHMKNRHSTE